MPLAVLTWALIALSLILDIMWMTTHGLNVAWHEAVPVAIAVGVCAAVRFIYTRRRPDAKIAQQMNMTMQLLAGSAIMAVFSYLMASLNMPLIDASLINADHALRFDWRQHMAWLNAHPWLCMPLTIAYASAIPQIILITIVLSLLGQFAAAQRFTFAFFLSAFACIIISGLWPSLGSYVYYNIQPTEYSHVMRFADRVHEADLLALRNGSLRVFPLLSAQGLISFPSFHTAIAVLLIYAGFYMRFLFTPMLIVNTLMIFSVFKDGGHYLVDMLSGLFITLAALGVAHWISRAEEA